MDYFDTVLGKYNENNPMSKRQMNLAKIGNKGAKRNELNKDKGGFKPQNEFKKPYNKQFNKNLCHQ